MNCAKINYICLGLKLQVGFNIGKYKGAWSGTLVHMTETWLIQQQGKWNLNDQFNMHCFYCSNGFYDNKLKW